MRTHLETERTNKIIFYLLDDFGFCQILLENLHFLASFFLNVFHLELHCQCLFICSGSKCGSSWIPLILFLFCFISVEDCFTYPHPFVKFSAFKIVFTMTLKNKDPLLKLLDSSCLPLRVKTQTSNVLMIKGELS